MKKAFVNFAIVAASIFIVGCGSSKKKDKATEPTAQSEDAGLPADAESENPPAEDKGAQLDAAGWSKSVRESFLKGETIAFDDKAMTFTYAGPTLESGASGDSDAEVIRIALYEFDAEGSRDRTKIANVKDASGLSTNEDVVAALLTSKPVVGVSIRDKESFDLGGKTVTYANGGLTIDWVPEGEPSKRVLDGGGVTEPTPAQTFVLGDLFGLVQVNYIGDVITETDFEVFALRTPDKNPVDSDEPVNDLQEFNGEGDGLDDEDDDDGDDGDSDDDDE